MKNRVAISHLRDSKLTKTRKSQAIAVPDSLNKDLKALVYDELKHFESREEQAMIEAQSYSRVVLREFAMLLQLDLNVTGERSG